jgi:hypothetical protein
MKNLASLIVLASLALALAGCSKAPPATSSLKNNDLGVLHVSSGKPSTYTLTDGRICTITPALLTSGYARLTVTIAETKGSKKTLLFEVPPDGHPDTLRIDQSTAITVAPYP